MTVLLSVPMTPAGSGAAVFAAPDHETSGLRVAVRVGRGVAALQPHLVRSLVPEVEEEIGVDAHTPRRVGDELDHPALDPLGIELRIPGQVEGVGDVDTATVPADLDHLRSTVERPCRRRVRRLTD